jgi:hypothetical protein
MATPDPYWLDEHGRRLPKSRCPRWGANGLSVLVRPHPGDHSICRDVVTLHKEPYAAGAMQGKEYRIAPSVSGHLAPSFWKFWVAGDEVYASTRSVGVSEPKWILMKYEPQR